MDDLMTIKVGGGGEEFMAASGTSVPVELQPSTHKIKGVQGTHSVAIHYLLDRNFQRVAC